MTITDNRASCNHNQYLSVVSILSIIWIFVVDNSSEFSNQVNFSMVLHENKSFCKIRMSHA